MTDHSSLAWEVLASLPYTTGRRLSVTPNIAHQRLVAWLAATPENIATSEAWLTLFRAGPPDDAPPQASGQEYALREFSLRQPIEQAIEGRPDGGVTVGFLRRRGPFLARWRRHPRPRG
jgi:hypothetical protein